MAELLRTLCILLVLLGFFAIPAGAFVGIASEGEGGTVTTAVESARMKTQARYIMLSGSAAAIGGFVGVYLIDRQIKRQ